MSTLSQPRRPTPAMAPNTATSSLRAPLPVLPALLRNACQKAAKHAACATLQSHGFLTGCKAYFICAVEECMPTGCKACSLCALGECLPEAAKHAA
eukprot:scaffold132076_cov19-Tisochrysis_lutea.AAC.4